MRVKGMQALKGFLILLGSLFGVASSQADQWSDLREAAGDYRESAAELHDELEDHFGQLQVLQVADRLERAAIQLRDDVRRRYSAQQLLRDFQLLSAYHEQMMSLQQPTCQAHRHLSRAFSSLDRDFNKLAMALGYFDRPVVAQPVFVPPVISYSPPVQPYFGYGNPPSYGSHGRSHTQVGQTPTGHSHNQPIVIPNRPHPGPGTIVLPRPQPGAGGAGSPVQHCDPLQHHPGTRGDFDPRSGGMLGRAPPSQASEEARHRPGPPADRGRSIERQVLDSVFGVRNR